MNPAGTLRRTAITVLVALLLALGWKSPAPWGLNASSAPSRPYPKAFQPCRHEGPDALAVQVLGAAARPGLYFLHPGLGWPGVAACAGFALPDEGLPPSRLFPGARVVITPEAGPPNVLVGRMPMTRMIVAGVKPDLNSLSAEDLAEVPGLNARLARRLVQARRSLGGFSRWDDVGRVSGVGRKTFYLLRQYTIISAVGRKSIHE